jgi:pilus assembly protein CpaE
VTLSISVVGPVDRELLRTLRERGFRAVGIELEDIDSAHPMGSKGPDAFVVDVRSLPALPREVSVLKRQFPTTGIVILAKTLDPTALLEAMRMGVNEWVAEPIDLDEFDAAVRRVARPAARVQTGRSIAVIGAKGGVGSTTVAVNLATALRKASEQPTLLIDLHLANGDAAVFVGAEPRFSVLDAVENIHRLDESYLKGLVVHTKAGFDLLGSTDRVQHGPIEAGHIRTLVAFASTVYRYVVIDCPRTDGTTLEAIDVASSVVVVANQELTTLRNASRIATVLRQRCGPQRVRLAISRFDPESEISRQDVERVLGGPVKYTFPSDYRTAIAAVNRGEPLMIQNHSRLAAAFDTCARDLGELPEKPKETNKGGLFGRLTGR